MRVLPDLTKDYILERISQEQIFERFTGRKVVPETGIISPLRPNENRPSAKYSYNQNGKLRLTDYTIGFNGDCFDLVGKKLSINSREKSGFMAILHVIAREFKIHRYVEVGDAETEQIFKVYFKTKEKRNFEPVFRQWSPKDAKYWKPGGITVKDLRASHVAPCSYIWEGDELIYYYKESDPCFAYYRGNSNNIIDWKFYFPERDSFRFISNSNKVQGSQFIESGPAIVITKSFKDVMVLRKRFAFGYPLSSIAPDSESIIMSEEQIRYLKRHYRMIFTLFDYDPTGLHASWMYRKEYATIPLLLKNPTWNKRIKYLVKDVFDYTARNGEEKVNELTESLEERFKEEYDLIAKYEYNALAWI